MNASAVALAVFAIVAAGPALAAPVITDSPTRGHPGVATQVSGTGFAAGEAVDIYFDTTDMVLGITNASGKFGPYRLKVPLTTGPGTHYITAIGRRNGDAAQVSFPVSTTWSSQGFDARGRRRNPYENVIGTSNAGDLQQTWTAVLGGTLGPASSPLVRSMGTKYNPYIFAATAFDTVEAYDANGKRKWLVNLPDGSASTIAAGPDGTIYATSRFDDAVYAFNGSTGAPIWGPASTGGSLESPPAVADGIVYVGCYDGKLYAFKAATGAPAWAAPASLGGQVGASSPAVADGNVYIGAFDGKIYAFDAKTGAARWTVTTGAPTWNSSPAAANGFVFATSEDGKLYAINSRTGGVAWTYPLGAATPFSAAVANNTVYVVGYVGSNSILYAIRMNGTLRWSATIDSGLTFASPSVANGVVYVSTSQLYGFDAATGEMLWREATDGSLYSGIAVSDGALYVANDNSELMAFAVDGNAARKRMHAEPPSFASLHPDLRLKPAH